MIYFQLFWEFVKVGIFCVGGGYASMPLIQASVVDTYHWLTLAEFIDIFTISQMTPGPVGINTATYVGYSVLHEAGAGELACILGSFTATTAVVLPSVIIMMIIVKAYFRLRDSHVFKNTMAWLKPTVVGLIGAAALILVTPENFTDWKSWCICAAAFAAAFCPKVHPILIIVVSAIVGLVVY